MTESELNHMERVWMPHTDIAKLISEIRRLKRCPDSKDIWAAAYAHANADAFQMGDFLAGVRWRDAWNEPTKEGET